jgi:hypothetical protein
VIEVLEGALERLDDLLAFGLVEFGGFPLKLVELPDKVFPPLLIRSVWFRFGLWLWFFLALAPPLVGVSCIAIGLPRLAPGCQKNQWG